MQNKISITLLASDAEPYLREQASRAARYSAYLDFFTRRTMNMPGGGSLDDRRKLWRDRYLGAKRIVEAFGVEVEYTTEPETMTVYFPHKGGKAKPIAGGMFNVIRGSKPDYNDPQPYYAGEVHGAACEAAADRVVRKWREALDTLKRAA